MKIITDENFVNELKIIANEYGIVLNDKVCENLKVYKELLVEWNEKINLTAITDNYGIIVKHFIDCLYCTKYISNHSKIVDIGTGAGFPGIVIAIFFEDKLEVTLVDSLNKRINFLNQVKEKLNLKNVNIISGRAEEIVNKYNFREKFDYCTSRAVAPLNIILEMTIPYLKKNGKGIYMKGQNYNEEILKSKNALKLLNCNLENIYNYNLNINDEMFERAIILTKKLENTDNKYPRLFSKIKNKPL